MYRNIAIRTITGKGRGIFALKKFQPGEIIEQVPVLVLHGTQYELLNQTGLKDYYLNWGEDACAIPLGFGMLYNHSDEPNAVTKRDLEAGELTLLAVRDIEAGQEISYKYECPPWFEVVD